MGEDLVVKGGKVTVSTVKEGCNAINVMGDMTLKKGRVTVKAKGKSSDGLKTSGYLEMSGGTLKSAVHGRYSTAIQAFGDLIQTNGAISASSKRDETVRCFDLLKVTGGKISAKSSSASEMAMDSGDTAVVKPACLVSIRGFCRKAPNSKWQARRTRLLTVTARL